MPPNVHFFTQKKKQKMFHYSTNEVLKLLIICNVYNNKVAQYVHINIFNFKAFCRRYQLHSLFISITFISIYRLTMFKACVRYFSTNFYLSPNDSPSKTMKDVFYFI